MSQPEDQPEQDFIPPGVSNPASLRQALRAAGYEAGVVLGAGMEGTVFDVGEDLVAKVWHRRGIDEITLLKTFYDAVREASPDVATPCLRSVLVVGTHVVSIEDRLDGTPMGAGFAQWPLTSDAVETITECLVHLAGITTSSAMALLPPLEGEQPFEPVREPFPISLARLTESRSARFRSVMRAAVRDIDDVVEATTSRLERLPPTRQALIHGDLLPPNILVGQDGRSPSAILDFGFLSMIGDPAFDAAVSASIFDMYGEHAREAEATLDQAISERLPYPSETLALYRASYALVTSNVYSTDGRDGHFAWCMRMVERTDVRAAIDM